MNTCPRVRSREQRQELPTPPAASAWILLLSLNKFHVMIDIDVSYPVPLGLVARRFAVVRCGGANLRACGRVLQHC
jgi:hypothetical protein